MIANKKKIYKKPAKSFCFDRFVKLFFTIDRCRHRWTKCEISTTPVSFFFFFTFAVFNLISLAVHWIYKNTIYISILCVLFLFVSASATIHFISAFFTFIISYSLPRSFAFSVDYCIFLFYHCGSEYSCFLTRTFNLGMSWVEETSFSFSFFCYSILFSTSSSSSNINAFFILRHVHGSVRDCDCDCNIWIVTRNVSAVIESLQLWCSDGFFFFNNSSRVVRCFVDVIVVVFSIIQTAHTHCGIACRSYQFCRLDGCHYINAIVFCVWVNAFSTRIKVTNDRYIYFYTKKKENIFTSRSQTTKKTS